MTTRGEWEKSSVFVGDDNYFIDHSLVAYIRNIDGKYAVRGIAGVSCTFDTLDEAKLVAEALVAMR